MRVAGLSGGIATGKSSVTRLCREQGVLVIDCDEIARDVVKQGSRGYRRVVALFGNEVLQPDGQLDRKGLGQLVFQADPRKRKQLNAALHPLITLQLVWRILCAWLRHRLLVVVDMPLLFETGSHRYTATSVLVMCPEHEQVQRLMARDECSMADARQRIEAQMPLSAKAKLASVTLDNSGAPDALRAQVQTLVARLRRGTFWHSLLTPAGLASLAVAAWLLWSQRRA